MFKRYKMEVCVSEPDTTLMLGDVQWFDVISYLEPRDILALGSTCRRFRDVCRTDLVWAAHAKVLGDAVRPAALSLLGEVSVAGRKNFESPNSYERLNLLESTVLQLGGLTFDQRNIQKFHIFLLVNALLRGLLDTAKMVGFISAQQVASVTCKFDAADMALRRYVDEFAHISEGPNVIKDPKGHDAWVAEFGKSASIVHFDAFFGRIIRKRWPDESSDPRFVACLKAQVNFPRDNLMTAYRFHCFVCVFGPFDELVPNFVRIAMGTGFLGLINLIEAEDILSTNIEFMPRKTVLIRYSRRRPDMLAFSSIDPHTRRVEHRRNVDRDGNPVPVARYLDMAFRGYDIIKMGVADDPEDHPTIFTFMTRRTVYTYSEYPHPDARREYPPSNK